MLSTDQLRLKASRCRRLAASIDDVKAHDALLALAEDFDRKAEAEPPDPPAGDPPGRPI
jgi:hypothetical protein